MQRYDDLASTAACKEVCRFYGDAQRFDPDAAEQALQRLGVQTRGFGPVSHWLVLAAAPSSGACLDAINVLRDIISRGQARPRVAPAPASLDELGEALRRRAVG